MLVVKYKYSTKASGTLANDEVYLYNELAEGHYCIVDHDDVLDCQKAYLSPDIDAIVMRTQGRNINIYYNSFQYLLYVCILHRLIL